MYNIMTDSFFVRKEELPVYEEPVVVPTPPQKIAQPALSAEDDEELRGFLDGTLTYDPATDSLSKASIDDEL